MDKRQRQQRATDLFKRADEQSEAGNLKSAFRLMLAAAKLGEQSCQLNLGNFYRDGIGVKPNRANGLYWYRRAHRRGDSLGGYNIGILYRNENHPKRALAWFQRALDEDNLAAALEMAKIYLQGTDKLKAVPHLEAVVRATPPYWVIEENRKEARRLLRRLGVVVPGPNYKTNPPLPAHV